VSSIASVYLRSQHTTYQNLLQAELIVSPACAWLAADNPDRKSRRRIRDFYKESRKSENEFDAFMATQNFQRLLSHVAGNPAISLLVDVLMDLARDAQGVARTYRVQDRRDVTIEHHQEVAELIWEGDGAAAADRMHKHLEEAMRWVDEATLMQTLDPPLNLGPSRVMRPTDS
jgi:DNA-binding FadR family transcriptional regulator